MQEGKSTYLNIAYIVVTKYKSLHRLCALNEEIILGKSLFVHLWP